MILQWGMLTSMSRAFMFGYCVRDIRVELCTLTSTHICKMPSMFTCMSKCTNIHESLPSEIQGFKTEIYEL